MITRPEQREEDHVADGGRVREHHREAVHAHAEAGRGRHAVLERANVVLVVVHRLLRAGGLLPHLLAEAFGLIVRVVELAERVAELAAVDEQLEPVNQIGARVIPAGERRRLERVVRDEDGDASACRPRPCSPR